MAEHRVEFVQRLDAARKQRRFHVHGGGHFLDLLGSLWQEFMQRRIEQADGDRQAGHDGEKLGEIRALHGQKLVQSRTAASFVFSQNHLAHDMDAPALEEHVFGTAKANTFSPEGAGGTRIRRRIGIGAHGHATRRIRPGHQPAKIAGQFRLDHGHFAAHQMAGRSVDSHQIAPLQREAWTDQQFVAQINPQAPCPDDTRNAHAARHHCRMAGHAAACGQDRFRHMHPVDVFRARLDAHQNNLAAFGFRRHRRFRGKHDLAGGCPRGCGKTGTDHHPFDARINRRMQQLIKRGWINAADGVFLGNQAFIHHVDGNFHGGPRGALARARLQHPQLAALDGKLHVLHIPVMGFQPRTDSLELGKSFRHQLFHRGLFRAGCDAPLFGQRLRCADACHHILTLGIDQELAIQALLTGGRIAGKGNAGGRGGAKIAEHHGLHIDGRAPIMRDIVQRAIGDGAGIAPAGKDGGNGPPELHMRILRESLAQLILDHLLVERHDMLPIDGRKLGVIVMTEPCLLILEDFLEHFMVNAQHHIAIHLDKATITVPGKAGVTRIVTQRLYRVIVQAKVENRIHHAGHRCTRTGANGQE